MSLRAAELRFAPPRFLRGLLIVCAVVAGLMNVLTFVVYQQEGLVPSVKVGGAICAGMGMLALHQLYSVLCSAVVYRDRVLIQKPFGVTEVRFESITELRYADSLYLHEADTVHRINFPTRAVLSALTQALEARLPTSKLAHHQWLSEFPIVLAPRRASILTNAVYLLLGASMLAIGLGTIWSIIPPPSSMAWDDILTRAVMSVVFCFAGALTSYLLLFKFVVGYVFSKEGIVVRHPIGQERFDTAHLETLSLEKEKRVYKGVERIAHMLVFKFDDGRTLKVEPTENGVPFEVDPTGDQRVLNGLLQTLKREYLRS